MTTHQSTGLLLAIVAAVGGSLLSIAVLGRSSEEKILLDGQSALFSSLAPESQAAVRRSFDDLKNQSPGRRAEIEEIHRTVSQDPELASTLDDFFQWWTALPQAERDQFRQLQNTERLDFIKTQTAKRSQLRSDITVNFPGQKSPMFSALHMSFDEYLAIIEQTTQPFEKPTVLQNDLAELQGSDQKALRLTLWLFLEYLPASRNGDQLRVIADSFADALEANVKDQAWSEKFAEERNAHRDRRFGESWLRLVSFIVIDRATVALGHSLQKRFPVTDREIIDAFAELTDKDLQHDLMKMPADEARIRLQLLAQSSGGSTAIQRLLSLYDQYSAQRSRLMRMPTGFGPPSVGGPGRNTPPAFEEDRPELDRQNRNRPPEPPRNGPDEKPLAEPPK